MSTSTMSGINEKLNGRQSAPVPQEELIEKEIERLKEGVFDEARQQKLELPSYLIDDFLPHKATGTLGGEAGAGKSTWLVHLARCLNHGIALGQSKEQDSPEIISYGIPNETGNVIYITPEDMGSVVNRLKAWDLKHDLDGSMKEKSGNQTYVWQKSPQLSSEINYQALLRVAKEGKPILIILDTLAVVLSEMGSKSEQPEHNNTLMTELYQYCQRLCSEISTCVVSAHHPSKAADDFRGAYAIKASSRFLWWIKPEGDQIKLSVRKGNDFDITAQTFTYKIEAQALGTNRQGKVIEMPVMTSGIRSPMVTGQKRQALQCLVDEIEHDGLAPRKDWEERIKASGITGARSIIKRLVSSKMVEGVKPNARGSFAAFRLSALGKMELGINPNADGLGL